jgi:hypothetical protein
MSVLENIPVTFVKGQGRDIFINDHIYWNNFRRINYMAVNATNFRLAH